MDKKLIERIALEVARDLVFPGFEIDDVMASALTKYASALLARIDAERGKGAVARIRYHDNGGVQHFNEGDCYVEWSALVVAQDGDGLFLSPTIPEGMALVPKHINYLDDTPRPEVMKLLAEPPKVGKHEEENDWYSRWWELLIAAAQGERNAD